jgi:hypothetical protein
MSVPSVRVAIGEERFLARLQQHLAPQSCARLLDLLPYRGELIHARWSGDSCWSPLGAVWPAASILEPENATSEPAPGEILLFGGGTSEPELLITYGLCRFACKVGPLTGNPVLKIGDEDLARLAECGRNILWKGAAPLHVERLT